MSIAMEPIAESKVLSKNPRLTMQVGAYTYEIKRNGKQSFYSVTDGKDTISLPILYAFGEPVALEARGDAAGAKARGYLGDRGITPATQLQFRLGYAPPDRFALKEHLGAQGISTEDMVEAGLLIGGRAEPVARVCELSGGVEADRLDALALGGEPALLLQVIGQARKPRIVGQHRVRVGGFTRAWHGLGTLAVRCRS